MADATVEWGEDRPARWFDRFLGPRDESGRPRFSAPAVGCGIIAIALMIAAEVLPWAVADLGTADQGPFGGDGREFLLGEVGGFLLVGYYPGCMAMLALIGVALIVGPPIRRVLVAAGVGWAAGLLVVTVGVARQATVGGAFTGQGIDANLGPGMFFGFAGVLVAAGALLLTGWHPGGSGGGRRPSNQEPDVDQGPPDLTVTPLD